MDLQRMINDELYQRFDLWSCQENRDGALEIIDDDGNAYEISRPEIFLEMLKKLPPKHQDDESGAIKMVFDAYKHHLRVEGWSSSTSGARAGARFKPTHLLSFEDEWNDYQTPVQIVALNEDNERVARMIGGKWKVTDDTGKVESQYTVVQMKTYRKASSSTN